MNTPADDLITKISQANAARGAAPIFLKWKGTKTPRGHSINGIEINGMQHGVVYGVGGDMIGTYERLMEFGGENGDEHEAMIVPFVKG